MKDEKKPDGLSLSKDMTLDEVRLAMLELMGQANIHHYRIGQLYNYTVERKLAEAAGYKNAQDYFSKNLVDMAQSSLSMYGAVARHFSEPLSRRFGVTCLYLLLTYAEAVGFEVDYEEPGQHVIDVPGDDGAVTARPFGQCSVGEMRKAIHHKRKPASKPMSAEDLALADRYLEAVTSGLPKGTPLRVQLRNHKGKVVLDFKGIPLTQVAQLIQVLQAQLPPQSEVTQEPPKAPQPN